MEKQKQKTKRKKGKVRSKPYIIKDNDVITLTGKQLKEWKVKVQEEAIEMLLGNFKKVWTSYDESRLWQKEQEIWDSVDRLWYGKKKQEEIRREIQKQKTKRKKGKVRIKPYKERIRKSLNEK